ncbi:MAG: TolC family protein [Acidobacteriaceae bacterium]
MTSNRSPISVPVFGFVFAFLVLLWPSPARAQQEPPPPGAPVPLTLPSAVDLALAHSHKVRLAYLSVRDSEEQKRIAESHFYPILKNDSAVHHITALQGVVLPAGALGHGTSAGLIPADTVRIDQGASTSYTSGTELAQPLTQLFRIHAGVTAADADLAASRLQAEDTANAIALEVHQLYYNYLIEQLQGAAAQDGLNAAAAAETENQQGVQEGKLLSASELASRANWLDQQRAVLDSKLKLDDLTLQLDDVLGLPMGTRVVLDPDALGDSPALPSRAEGIAQLMQQNPSVLAAQKEVDKARAGLHAAHDAYIPDITGFAHYSYQSGLPFLEHNFGVFGASFSYNLFDGGAREANVHDARVKLSMAQEQLAQTEDDARIQISAAYDKVELLEELLKVANQTLQAREENERIEAQRARVQAELASGVAAAHAAATAARASVLEARLDLYLAQNNILTLLGKQPR